MINCDIYLSQIDAYADGALSSSERAAMESHRVACPACRAAADQAQRLGGLLRAELPKLAATTPTEQVALRENVLHELDVKGRSRRPLPLRSGDHSWPVWALRLVGAGAVLALALLVFGTLLPGGHERVSAAEVVGRAWAAVGEYQGMSGVLHWEADWNQRFPIRDRSPTRDWSPSGGQITRTFEIWFDFDHPGRYRITQRDLQGRVYSEMVRDGVSRMWQLSRTVAADGREQVLVDEIVLSPEEMENLASWYVPSSPLLDDLDRFAEVLDRVELITKTQVAGRPAYILRGQLFGFGLPDQESRIDPLTSTVQLIVDAETYWLLGRTERVSLKEGGDVAAGFVQRTRRFELLPPEQVPPDVFTFVPPPGAEVRTVQGVDGYYAPTQDAIGLKEAATLTSFTLVLPTELPDDLEPRPFFRYQGPGPAGTFGIVYLGPPGRQAFLLEYEGIQPLERAARLVKMGEQQGWLVTDPIDGRKFSLVWVEPQPASGPDGRPWPRTVELQAWGLSLDEAVAMLVSLMPYHSE